MSKLTKQQQILPLGLLDITENVDSYGTEFYQISAVDDFIDEIKNTLTECKDLLENPTNYSELDDALTKLDETLERLD